MSSTLLQSRILVLGAGLLHAGHYEAIRAMNCFTIGMDRNPEAPARNKADLFLCRDPGDIEQVTNAAAEQHVAGILSLSEFGVIPAAIASKKLGLRQISPESAQRARDKFLMRQAWARDGISQPAFSLVSDLDAALRAAKELSFPLIIKPRTHFGARGVRLISNEKELQTAFAATSALSPDGVLLEEQISGIECSVEGIIINNVATVLAFADKELRPHSQYRVTRSINYPAALTKEQIEQIRECAVRCVQSLGLDGGPFHLEVFIANGKVLPIECGARGGGGHIFSHIVKIVSGVDFVQAAVQLLLGEIPLLPKPVPQRGACYRFLFPPEGKFLGNANEEIVRRDERIIFLSLPKIGAILREPEHGALRNGYLVTRGADRMEALQAADQAEGILQWEVE